MKKNAIVRGGSIIALACVFVTLALFNPLYWSRDVLRWWLLSKVPRGSPRSELLTRAKDQGWEMNGWWHPLATPIDTAWAQAGNDGLVVWIDLGPRSAFSVDRISTFWLFDTNDHLIGVEF